MLWVLIRSALVHQGASNEHPQHGFYGELEKNHPRIIVKYSSLTNLLMHLYAFGWIEGTLWANSEDDKLIFFSETDFDEPAHDKTNKMTGLPGKSPISIGIRPVGSVLVVHSFGC